MGRGGFEFVGRSQTEEEWFVKIQTSEIFEKLKF